MSWCRIQYFNLEPSALTPSTIDLEQIIHQQFRVIATLCCSNFDQSSVKDNSYPCAILLCVRFRTHHMFDEILWQSNAMTFHIVDQTFWPHPNAVCQVGAAVLFSADPTGRPSKILTADSTRFKVPQNRISGHSILGWKLAGPRQLVFGIPPEIVLAGLL
jgi:hypothetical protein